MGPTKEKKENKVLCLGHRVTHPETNIAPENGWLEYYFPIGEADFQVRTVSFREGTFTFNTTDFESSGFPQRGALLHQRVCIGLSSDPGGTVPVFLKEKLVVGFSKI